MKFRNINTMKCTDYLVVLWRKVCSQYWNETNRIERSYYFKININKSKVMGISKPDQPLKKSLSGDKQLEVFEHFEYLGSVITRTVYCMKVLRVRIFNAKETFTKKRTLLTGLEVEKETRV